MPRNRKLNRPPRVTKPKRPRAPGSSRDKGDLVEDIVALLYESDEWTVEKRKFLPVPDEPNDTREIDVLVSSPLAGKLMHVAIECKNFGQRVGIKEMDAFISKLNDVRIPPQNGIFVSVNGYESGALRRARKEGIRTLVLDGLTPDRMATEVNEAFQSVIYLLLEVKKIVITSEVEHDDAWCLLWFRDTDGRFCGWLLDLIWVKWRDGHLPTELGEYEVSIDLPKGWRWSVGGTTVPNTAKTTVEVKGAVITDIGKAERYVLRDAETREFYRAKIDSSFSDGRRTLPVTWVRTEEDLEALLAGPAIARITIGRIPFPRMRYKMFWPPSQRAVDAIDQRVRERLRDAWWKWWLFKMRFDPEALVSESVETMTSHEIEGTDLSVIWEPIMPSHPASKDQAWPFSPSRMRPAAKRVTVRPRRRLVGRDTDPIVRQTAI